MTTASKKDTNAVAKTAARKPKSVEPTATQPVSRRADKDQPLIEDIRLLGRILGDVIREQEGVDAYGLVEQIQSLSETRAERVKALTEGRGVDVILDFVGAPYWNDNLASLAVGGRLVAPIAGADGRQMLLVVDKTAHGLKQTVLESVHFVPLKSGVA